MFKWYKKLQFSKLIKALGKFRKESLSVNVDHTVLRLFTTGRIHLTILVVRQTDHGLRLFLQINKLQIYIFPLAQDSDTVFRLQEKLDPLFLQVT